MDSFDAWLLRFLDDPWNLVGAAALALALVLAGLYFRLLMFYLRFVAKSLARNPLRSALTGLATMALVFIVTLVWSIFALLDRVTEEKSRDLKAIVTERWQLPSQMPFAYASTLEEGAAADPGDYRVDKDNDAMTWQFYGGTIDPAKRTRENIVFFFCMEPGKLLKMMDGIDEFTPQEQAALAEACREMERDPRKVIVGRERLAALQKQVGERMTVTSFNYKDIDLEVEIIATFPEGRYNQSALMNRDYLNQSLDAYERKTGKKHAMAEKSLNLVWVRVPDTATFGRVADQVQNHGRYTAPAVKCETASSGIASWLEPYRGLLRFLRWMFIPAVLAVIALVIATAISISVRERRIEMAVLKVLGFAPRQILVLVLGEAVLIGVVSGVASAGGTWFIVDKLLGGLKFPIAFFPSFMIPGQAWLWGALVGAGTAVAGSFLPAWSARSVKVSEVFAKIS
jgi:putative ABC transport system permease protein